LKKESLLTEKKEEAKGQWKDDEEFEFPAILEFD
jgi:hypothetical protein